MFSEEKEGSMYGTAASAWPLQQESVGEGGKEAEDNPTAMVRNSSWASNHKGTFPICHVLPAGC